jgi:hypothetical protein
VAVRTWASLKRSAKAGPRRTLPALEEIDALLAERGITTIVFFLDDTFEELAFSITTTVSEAVEQLSEIIKLEHYQTFTLFECRKLLNQKSLPEPVQDEHMLLDDNKYIAGGWPLGCQAGRPGRRAPAAAAAAAGVQRQQGCSNLRGWRGRGGGDPPAATAHSAGVHADACRS